MYFQYFSPMYIVYVFDPFTFLLNLPLNHLQIHCNVWNQPFNTVLGLLTHCHH